MLISFQSAQVTATANLDNACYCRHAQLLHMQREALRRSIFSWSKTKGLKNLNKPPQKQDNEWMQ